MLEPHLRRVGSHLQGHPYQPKTPGVDASTGEVPGEAVEAAVTVTVHGRTAADMFRGSADWDRIAAIKPYLRAELLVIDSCC